MGCVEEEQATVLLHKLGEPIGQIQELRLTEVGHRPDAERITLMLDWLERQEAPS